MNKRQSIPFVLLFVTFLIWLYLKPELLNTAEEETRPTFIAHEINNDHYNKDGFLDLKFAATQMIDIEKNKHIKFNDPKIDIFIKDKATNEISQWRITSLDGKLFDSNKLILSNDVLVENLTKDQLVQKLTTIEMTFLLNEKELYSDKLVNLEGPQMTQEGVGMWGSLNNEELIFKNKIKAVYLNEKNKIIKKALLVSSILMSFSTFAQLSDRDKPIEVESISQHIKMKENIVTFTGDVLLTQGSIKLTGDKLTVTKKKIANNEIMISYGKPATFFQIMDDGKPINAKANKIKYDVAKAKITLIGNSEVKQLDSKINGTEIIYYLETEELTVNRAKNTKERVNTIFLPKQFDKKETKKTPIKEK